MNPTTGGLELVLGVHGLTTGTHIKLAPNSLTLLVRKTMMLPTTHIQELQLLMQLQLMLHIIL